MYPKCVSILYISSIELYIEVAIIGGDYNTIE